MKNSDFLLRKCGPEDVDAILLLQDCIFEEMEGDRSILRKNDRDMFEACVRPPHLSMGLFDGAELVGICILYDGQGTADDLAADLETVRVERAMNAKLVMIRKRYRGRRFQQSMLWIGEKLAGVRGFDYLCATVSPDNRYSSDNCLQSGYVLDHRAVKYGGLIRDVYVKRSQAGEYFERVAEFCESMSGQPKEALEAYICTDHCYQGTSALCTPGDIAEYRNTVTGDSVYGICCEGKVLLPQEDGTCCAGKVLLPLEDGICRVVDRAQRIGELERIKIWINPVRREWN